MAHRAETLRSIHRAMSECLLSAGSPRIASLPLEGKVPEGADRAQAG